MVCYGLTADAGWIGVTGIPWRHWPRDLESVAGPVNMDVNPLVLLFLPDPRLFRVNGVRHVISDTDNSQRRLISLPSSTWTSVAEAENAPDVGVWVISLTVYWLTMQL